MAISSSPMAIAAHPDGEGATWLARASGFLPKAQLLWHCGARLTPAHPTWMQRLFDARKLVDEAASWLDFAWDHLPGKAMPHPDSGSLHQLARALPAVMAEPLLRGWRQAPADLFPSIRSNDDVRLSLYLSPPLQRAEAEALAEDGGFPSPAACAWVLTSRFEPAVRRPPASCQTRMLGILRAYPSLSAAIGVVADPRPHPKITPAAASVFDDAAGRVLAGLPALLPDELAAGAARAQSKED